MKLVAILLLFVCFPLYSQKPTLTVPIGHVEHFKAAFNHDSQLLFTASSDGTAKLWDVKSGMLIRTLEQNTRYHEGSANIVFVTSPVFSNDNKLVAAITVYVHHHDMIQSMIAKVWDVSTGQLVHTFTILEDSGGAMFGDHYAVRECVAIFSPNGKQLWTYSPGELRTWDLASGKQSKPRDETGWQLAVLSPDKKWVARFQPEYTWEKWFILNPFSDRLWTPSRQKPDPKGLTKVLPSFSGDSKLVVISDSLTAGIYDLGKKTKLQSFTTDVQIIDNKISESGKYVALSSEKSTKVWNANTGALLYTVEHTERYSNYEALENPGGHVKITFSPDETTVVIEKSLYRINDGTLMFEFPELPKVELITNYDYPAMNCLFSPDGKLILHQDMLIPVNSVTSAKKLEKGNVASIGFASFLTNNRIEINDKAFDPLFGLTPSTDTSRNYLPYDFLDSIKDKWRPDLRLVRVYGTRIGDGIYSPDGKYFISEAANEFITIWNVEKQKEIRTFKTGKLVSINLSNCDALFISGSQLLWVNLLSGNEIMRFTLLNSGDLIAIHPSGMFDALPGSLTKLRFVQSNVFVDLSQLKDRYYEPGLWRKVVLGEKLRSVSSFKSIDLPPGIEIGQVDDNLYVPIKLINRGGGIGEVSIFIQGKEVTKDAREKGSSPDAESMSIRYYLGKHKNLANGTNRVGVKAWNKDHWVESRGSVEYDKPADYHHVPTAYIITSGISDYAGDATIDLNYAAKDAEDMSKVLGMGASRLFGVEKTVIYNLTTSQPKELWPTKATIKKTFEKIATTAQSDDIVIAYLSGHGVNIGGAEGDWYYLTQEAYTTDISAYNDPGIRDHVTISSNELIDLFNSTSVGKQVLIIDACAAGRVVDNLIAKKDVPSSTIRALDRMQGRTGMHIITGCAADAVSYEASKYGQGVFTYSLLEGIRGGALRNDEFVDVNTLFQYARERVPVLAAGIGGIQSPVIFSPNGSESFDIGQLNDVDKKEVPISKIRPVYIQSNFQDDDEMSDVLGLSKTVDRFLSESASKGVGAPLIFVPVRDYPDGCQLVGRYKKEGDKIKLKLRKKCEGQDTTRELIGNDVTDLATQAGNLAVRN